MKVASHRKKIERLMALRQRLDPLEDFELWFWAGMTASTHAVNAAFHQAGAGRLLPYRLTINEFRRLAVGSRPVDARPRCEGHPPTVCAR
jgi:hypothetical protein